MRSRLLPRGGADLLRQIVLFCGAYWLYRLVRGQVYDKSAAAFDNARDIVDAERALGLFIEPTVQSWAIGTGWVDAIGAWMYVNTHFVVTTCALAFIYLFRNEHFYWIRNMFMVAMGLALVGYVAFPTAPPRLLPELGFTDSVAHLTGVTADDALFNPYAAVPSMHVAFALMLGVPLVRICQRRWAKVLWGAYPALVTFVVVVTANHWVLDAAAGAAVAAVSAVAAQTVLARVRPECWAWQSLPAPARAG